MAKDKVEDQAPEPRPAGDGGVDEVQANVDEELDRGFRGLEVDPTPNENYTVQGVTSGAPTPETDPAFAESNRPALRDVERQVNGVAER